MLVRFTFPWFAPSGRKNEQTFSMSGRLYAKGVHEVPYELKDFLPGSAVIVDGPEEEVGYAPESLQDFDDVRQNAAANDALLEKRRKIAAEMRARKAAKDAARLAEQLNEIK